MFTVQMVVLVPILILILSSLLLVWYLKRKNLLTKVASKCYTYFIYLAKFNFFVRAALEILLDLLIAAFSQTYQVFGGRVPHD